MDCIYLSQHRLFTQITVEGAAWLCGMWVLGEIVVSAQQSNLKRQFSGLHSHNSEGYQIMFPAGTEIILGDLWSPVSPSHPLFPFLSSTICYFCRWVPAWRSVGCAAEQLYKKHPLSIRANICLVVSEQGKDFSMQWDSFSCISNTGIWSPEHHLQFVCFTWRENRIEQDSSGLWSAGTL